MLELTQKGTDEPLYQFVQYGAEVVGNHINIGGYNNQSINISDKTKGTQINDLPVWFTIPAGAHCVLEIKNIQKNNAYRVAVNFRNSSNQSSVFSVGIERDYSDQRKEVTLSDAEEITCFFMYMSNSSTRIQFDVFFYVNGVRYI